MLSKDSSELLISKENGGQNGATPNSENRTYPGPMAEIHFWEAKCMNLESLYEQMKAQTTKNMASILENTDRWGSKNEVA